MNATPTKIITMIGNSFIGFTNAKDNEIILSQIREKGYNNSKKDEFLRINTLTDHC